jgi:oligoribonuclease
LVQAESIVFDFIQKHITPGECPPLAGNSVHVDKQFLKVYMPRVASLLHYRIVDVSTIKELCRRWYPNVFQGYVKKTLHRSLEDILESIDELRYYRQHIFRTH